MVSVTQYEFKSTPRFTIERRLGSGSFGVVYQAYDQERASLVALKTLNNIIRKENADALYRFKREFRSLTDVTHRNLITLYELIAEGDNWFFTMELVKGISFIDYVYAHNNNRSAKLSKEFSSTVEDVINSPTIKYADAPLQQAIKAETLNNIAQTAEANNSTTVDQQIVSTPPPLSVNKLDIDRLRSALRQLAEGVHALHLAGKLHRDIKPQNVLVTEEGRVVILDFGLVIESHIEVDESLAFAGTPTHMSPEQAVGEASPASDWYSVGIILYEALTGQLPYKGSFMEMLTNKQKIDAVPPKYLVPNIPDDLNDLCLDLLKRNPKDRPDGATILQRLSAQPSISSSINRASQSGSLIGREKHLIALQEAFLAIKKGYVVTAYIYGCSGMGKSILLQRFLNNLHQSEKEVLVLSGRCYEQESVPFKSLDSLMDALCQYLKKLNKEEIEPLIPEDVLALARLFPVLQQIEMIANADRSVLEIPDSQEVRRRAFIALKTLITRLAQRRLLILFIDDLQWGDLDSSALLKELLTPPNPPPLLLLASFRSEDIDRSPSLRSLFTLKNSKVPMSQTVEIEVAELSYAESAKLAASLLSDKVGDKERSFAETIAREAGGSPYFIDELVQHVLSGNEFQQNKANLNSNGNYTLEAVIQERVNRLPIEARCLLEVIAVAGQPLERSIARQIAQLAKDEQNAVSLLRVGHFIRVIETSEREEIDTYHDRIRETVLTTLDTTILNNYHDKLGLLLEAQSRVDAVRLAVHFNCSGDYAKALKYALIAAEQATNGLAFEQAVKLYKQAIELWEKLAKLSSLSEQDQALKDSIDINLLYTKLGNALTYIGRGQEAANMYLIAAKDAATAQKLELKNRAAEQLLRSGHLDEGLKITRDVLGTINMYIAETPNRAILSLLKQRIKLWWRGLKFNRRDAHQVSQEELIKIDACWSVAIGLSIIDTIRGSDFQARHLLLALNSGEPFRIARAIALEGGYTSVAGCRTQHKTEKLLLIAGRLAKESNNPQALGFVTLMAGITALNEGRWQKVVELTQQAEYLFRENCVGVRWELDNVDIYSLHAQFYLGEIAELTHKLPALLRAAQERGDLYAETGLRTRSHYLACLVNNEVEQAEQTIAHAYAHWSLQGFHLQHFFGLLAEIQIALYKNDYQKAWQIINDRWPALNRSLLLRIQIILIEALNMRALTALAMATISNDKASFLKIAEKEARRIEKEDVTWGNGMAKSIRGQMAMVQGNQQEAISWLADAEFTFELANMKLFAMSIARRRGELIGGEQGSRLLDGANSWFNSQQIKNIEAISSIFVPVKVKHR